MEFTITGSGAVRATQWVYFSIGDVRGIMHPAADGDVVLSYTGTANETVKPYAVVLSSVFIGANAQKGDTALVTGYTDENENTRNGNLTVYDSGEVVNAVTAASYARSAALPAGQNSNVWAIEVEGGGYVYYTVDDEGELIDIIVVGVTFNEDGVAYVEDIEVDPNPMDMAATFTPANESESGKNEITTDQSLTSTLTGIQLPATMEVDGKVVSLIWYETPTGGTESAVTLPYQTTKGYAYRYDINFGVATKEDAGDYIINGEQEITVKEGETLTIDKTGNLCLGRAPILSGS